MKQRVNVQNLKEETDQSAKYMKAIREAIDVKFERSTDELLHTLSDEIKGGKHRTEEMI